MAAGSPSITMFYLTGAPRSAIGICTKRTGGLFRVRPFLLLRFCGFTRSVQDGTKCLLGGEFFLLAFHAHLLELALFGFDRCRNFLLDLGCRFFELG